MLPISCIFMSPIQKSANLAMWLCSTVLILKIHRDLNNYYLFQKICKYLPITSKNNLKFKTFKLDFRPPKCENWFLTWSKSFSLFLASNKTKEDVPHRNRLRNFGIEVMKQFHKTSRVPNVFFFKNHSTLLQVFFFAWDGLLH